MIAALVLLAGTAFAGPIFTQPAVLAPGDQYRLVFVTSTTRDATSSNIGDYNTFVTNAAAAVTELAALGTTWSAIGSTATVDARDNTGTNPFSDGAGVRIYDLLGTKVADTNSDLWDGSIDSAIATTEQGLGLLGRGYVYTGTGLDGTRFVGRPLGLPATAGGVTGHDLRTVHVVGKPLGPQK